MRAFSTALLFFGKGEEDDKNTTRAFCILPQISEKRGDGGQRGRRVL